MSDTFITVVAIMLAAVLILVMPVMTMADRVDVYYSIFTTQIEDVINSGKNYNLKEGDIVNVTVRNTNKTLSQTLKNFFYTVTGNDTYTISASSGGMVVSTGENNE